MTNMTLRPWMLGLAGAAVSCLAPLAAAQVTPALDRVPGDAMVAVTFKNVGALHSNVETLAKTLHLPAQAMMGIGHMGDVLKTPGVNAGGSAAVAIMAPAAGVGGAGGEAGEDGEGGGGASVVIVPVSDYAGFVAGLGGKAGEAVSGVQFEGRDMFVKDLGGGFAAMGDQQTLVTNFAGKAGGGKAFEGMMGPSGRAVAESADAYAVINVPALAPMINAGVGAAMKNVQDTMAAMAPDKAPNFEAVTTVVGSFTRDAQGAVIGVGLDGAGLRLDFAAQFKEGSPSAAYFSGKAAATKLLSMLPAQPYLLAVAIDTASPGLKKAMTDAAEFSKKMRGDKANPFGGMSPMENAAKTDGVAFFLGTSPGGIMSGLFQSATAYVKTSDPASFTGTMKTALTEMNGKTVEGITYQSAYETGAKAGEKTVDAWSMRMQPDPTNPQAQQIGQAQMMMFGPSGLGGYIAPANGGLVVTYSKNPDLLGKALEAANGGGDAGIAADPDVKDVASHLPRGGSVAAFVGVKSILDMVMGFAPMMGMDTSAVKLPEKLAPIGAGVVTDQGGMRGTVFVPTAVLQTFKSLGDAMGGGQDEGNENENGNTDEKTGQPKF
jgi:hypothetical protein